MEQIAPPLKRNYRYIMTAILLVAFGLRVYRLGYQSLRGDEGATYFYIIRSLAELVDILRVTDPHPPLYHVSMHGWFRLAGGSEFALRYPTVVTSVLLVASLAVLGKTLLDFRLGLATALLVAVNSYQIFYAQDARPYPLATLLGVLSTIWLWWALQRQRWLQWAIYGIFVLAAMYTHYYAAFIVIFQGLFVIWVSWRRHRFPWRYTIIGVIAWLLYLPWVLFIWKLFTSYQGFGETVGMVDSIWRPLIAFAGGQFLDSPIVWAFGLMVVVPLLCLGAVGLWRKRQIAAVLAILYLAVPLLAVYIASRPRPIFNERYLIAASPGFLLLIGAALVTLLSYRRAWLTVTSLVAAMALLAASGFALTNYYFDPQFAKSPPWRDVLGYIAGKAKPGDALVYTAPLPPILYYNQGNLTPYLIPYEPDTTLPEAAGQLQRVLDDHPRVWLVPVTSDASASLQMEPWLDRHSARLDQTFFRIIHIGLYESPAAFSKSMTPQSVQFADGIQLKGFRLADGNTPLILEAGEAVPLTLVWSAERTPTNAYTVFTHLVGPDGALWGQRDNPPVWGTYPTTKWENGEIVFDQYLIPVEKNAPPGEYHLLVGLYDPVSGARLSAVDDQEEPIGDHILLDAEVTVQ